MAGTGLTRKKYNKASEYMVRLYPQDQPDLQGRIEHVQTGEVQYFASYMELIILMHEKMEEHKFPQPGMEVRTW